MRSRPPPSAGRRGRHMRPELRSWECRKIAPVPPCGHPNPFPQPTHPPPLLTSVRGARWRLESKGEMFLRYGPCGGITAGTATCCRAVDTPLLHRMSAPNPASSIGTSGVAPSHRRALPLRPPANCSQWRWPL
ncbi:hypothetical protein PVAP13_1KG054577 [Panicum virgatum]|uniref:Uncharacterized protein n=1 Tax=Panicum virgatum TaxID=38727 RepID=A0A8T0XDY7_PANVG|nr:hypothetical protein PVAP13_1KG054577 [Panicum virgatum]